MNFIFLFLFLFQPPPDPNRTIYLGAAWRQQVDLYPQDRVTLIGFSAGAHSAAMIALDPANEGKVAKVKLASGPYKIGFGVRAFSAIVPEPRPSPLPFFGSSVDEVSPIYRVTKAGLNAPVWELYNAQYDLPGLKWQAIRFKEKLQQAGYNVTLTEVPNTNHFSIEGFIRQGMP